MPVDISTALKFLERVKGVYGEDSQSEYQGFMDLMKDFKGGRTTVRETHRRVIALFREHLELVEGYTVFMAPGDTIHIPADPQESILVTMTTGTMEIARDGTLVNETHVNAAEPEGEETGLPELAGQEKRSLA